MKKPHFHLVFIFDSLKGSNQVKEITDKIKSVGQLKVLSISGTIRYLTHKECKDKAQYDEKDIVAIGGVDVNKYLKNETEKEEDTNKEFYSIVNLCVEFSLFEFADLVDFLLCTERYEQFKLGSYKFIFLGAVFEIKTICLAKRARR